MNDEGRGLAEDGATNCTLPPADGPVLRIAPATRHCGRCGANATAADAFCTVCGDTLEPAVAAAATDTPVLAAPPPVEQTLVAPPVAPQSVALRRSRLLPGLALVAVLLLAAAPVFGLLWRSQANHAARLSHQLDATTLTLQRTQATLASTQAKLTATSALSAKRRAVLLQAQTVLKKVDPLLSSVDDVQQRAGDLQSQGTTTSSDAESLIQTTVTLVNYLVEWGGAADTSYVNGLIDEANSELSAVRADETLFAANTSTYNKASSAFGQKADAFSSAVRSLQTQLKGVAGR